ncbi:MAG: LysR family transcriptional regulator [Tannerella sp.]|jgi:LysR family hydrogen peroxide-inducible transcriptional activator|nr:LysR family transcriptional regulator [Tannerella sp.]
MTVQQLEYVIALDNYRHFAKAAESCGVTQPTLSMMIQKLEEELDVKIFDRLPHPIEPTGIGKLIIKQARTAIFYFQQIRETVRNEKNILSGDFKLGVIPTVASFLVPELLKTVSDLNPDFSLIMQEAPTTTIIDSVTNGKLDGGLAATPLYNPSLIEIPVYYEKFYAYVSSGDSTFDAEEIDINSVDIQDIWLLENVHCMRGQVLSLCEQKKEEMQNQAAKYESGSIDTLINIVDYNGGLTVIPEMAAMSLPEEKQSNLRRITGNNFVREISIVVNVDYVRENMTNAIVELVRQSVPKSMQDPKLKQYAIGVNL